MQPTRASVTDVARDHDASVGRGAQTPHVRALGVVAVARGRGGAGQVPGAWPGQRDHRRHLRCAARRRAGRAHAGQCLGGGCSDCAACLLQPWNRADHLGHRRFGAAGRAAVTAGAAGIGLLQRPGAAGQRVQSGRARRLILAAGDARHLAADRCDAARRYAELVAGQRARRHRGGSGGDPRRAAMWDRRGVPDDSHPAQATAGLHGPLWRATGTGENDYATSDSAGVSTASTAETKRSRNRSIAAFTSSRAARPTPPEGCSAV